MLGVVEAFEEAEIALFAEDALADVEIVVRTVRRVGSTTEFRLMIDRPTGVDLALCEKIAGHLNAALRDRNDLYTLQVESAGLDRPLVRELDYERFAGREVCIKTHELIDGAKTHRGTLEGLRDGDVIFVVGETEKRIPFGAIKSANIEFDIREALRKGRERESGKNTPKSRKERRTS